MLHADADISLMLVQDQYTLPLTYVATIDEFGLGCMRLDTMAQ